MRYALLDEFPGGEAGALEEGARLVGVDDLHQAARVQFTDDAERRAGPAVASAPVLRCVSTRSGRSTPAFLSSQSAPSTPIARLASTSSRWTAAASARTASESLVEITRSTHP